MAEHAPLPPSSAHLWGNCSASVEASRGVPNFGSVETEEGTAAHWALSETLAGWKFGAQTALLECVDFIGKTAPNGVVIDDEMAECAQMAVDDVVGLCQQYHAPFSDLRVEHRVTMARINEHNWGTLDIGLPLWRERVLVIEDYKHGHRLVSARENLQLIDYAEGLLHELGFENFDTVMFRIVRPRAFSAQGPIDVWTCPVAYLRKYWEKLARKAQEAMTGNGVCTTGEWCRDCPGLLRCHAARSRDYNMIDLVNQPLVMEDMPPEDMAVELAILEAGLTAASKRRDALEAQLIHAISQGAITPLAVQPSQGRVKWARPVGEVIAFAKQFGVDASKPDAKTPTQVAALVPKGLRFAWGEAAKAITLREPGALKLISREESRVSRAFKRN